MITSEPISKQPKRGTDGARVLKPALLAKSMMVEGERKMIKRCAAACHLHIAPQAKNTHDDENTLSSQFISEPRA